MYFMNESTCIYTVVDFLMIYFLVTVHVSHTLVLDAKDTILFYQYM